MAGPEAKKPAAVEATSEEQAALEAVEEASSCKEVAVADTEGLGEAYCEGQHQVQAASFRRIGTRFRYCTEKPKEGRELGCFA